MSSPRDPHTVPDPPPHSNPQFLPSDVNRTALDNRDFLLFGLAADLNGASGESTQETPTGNVEAPTRTPGAPPRRRRNKSITDSVDGGGSVASTPADSPAREGGPIIPKGGRKKKAKGAGTTADGGSSRSAKSRAARAALSDGGVGQPHEGESAENLPVILSPRQGEGL